MKDLITELDSKVKDCNNTTTIFDTRKYVLMEDAKELLRQALSIGDIIKSSPTKTEITEEFLLKNDFNLYKKKGIIILYKKDKMIFEFGASNIPILRQWLNDKDSLYIAGVKHWEDVSKFYNV